MKNDMIIDLPFNDANRLLFETEINFEEEEKRLEKEEERLKEENNGN